MEKLKNRFNENLKVQLKQKITQQVNEKFEVNEFKFKTQTMIKILILFLFLALINLTFLVIIKINPSLHIFFENYNLLKENFGPQVIATRFEIEFLCWISFSLNIISILLISITIPIFKTKIKNISKVFYLLSIAAIGVLMIVIESISEYSYSKFYNLFEFLSNEDSKPLFVNNEKIVAIQEEFSKMLQGENSNNLKYKWTTDTLTWWLAIFKIIFVILFFNSSIRKGKNISKIIDERVIKASSNSKFKDFIGKFYLNNTKNILFWLIMGTTLVFITPLVLMVNMSCNGTPMSTMLNWTFIVRDLYKSVGYENLNELKFSSNSSYFVIKLLPILCSGFLIANILISTVAYVKNWRTTRKNFIFEFIVLIIEILVVIIVIAHSGYQGQKLTIMWNEKKININPLALESNYLKYTYGAWYKDGCKVPEPWMSGLKYISQTIISLSFLSTIYIILGVKFRKLEKNKY